MNRKRMVALGLVALVAVLAVGLIAVRAFADVADPGDPEGEVEDDGPDVPITGDALQQASAAALAYTGGGTVTGTEVGDEEGYYEIEVTLDDGRQVDVHLDEAFHVLGSEVDGAEDD